MIELRQRSARTSYQRLSTEDEIDVVPTLNNYRTPKAVRTTKSAFCVVFLSIVAYLLGSNSIYFKVSKENQNRKPELVEGVLGAIFMYLACLGFSGYCWYKAATESEPDPRFVD